MKLMKAGPDKATFDQWGQILGRVGVPDGLLARSSEMAAQYYEEAEA